MLVEDAKEVVGMLAANIFDAKIVDDQDELDGAPNVSPEAWRRGGLMVSRRVEPFAEEVVG